jgi:hypothetical protein
MEDVLELYAEAYEPTYPVVCFDECPFQMTSETRTSIPAKPGQPERVDYEYQREGICNLFMFFEPLGNWRHVKVTARRTAHDYAQCLKDLVDIHYPTAQVISIVQDNLNTHTPAALYAAFEPTEARRIIERLDFRYTPKHGSWLNMAEIELSVLMRQCLNRRLSTPAAVGRATSVWACKRNDRKATVNWQFTTDDARIKLRSLYPS